MGTSTSFARLEITGWRQFGEVNLDLTSRLTVLTGPNGTGKTTLLNVLGQHFNPGFVFLGVPVFDERGQSIIMVGLRATSDRLIEEELEHSHRLIKEELEHRHQHGRHPRPIVGPRIGLLEYANGTQTKIHVPETPYGLEYNVEIPDQNDVRGLFLESHRELSRYQKVESIPPSFGPSESILSDYLQGIRRQAWGANANKSPMLLMKERLLAAAIYGEGNSSVVPDPQAEILWRGFQDVLRKLLPSSLKFRRLVAQPPEIIVESEMGRFPIDAVSGGIHAIIEVAWQVFLQSHHLAQFTICFDEPENHLHPSLQRAIIPGLLDAFPHVKFIVATHSPFIVTSTPDANVYVLDFDDGAAVNSQRLDFKRRAASAEETLRNVLGLPSTLPVWAEERFDSIVAKYLTQAPTPELLRRMRQELMDSGLEAELSDAVTQITDNALIEDTEEVGR